MSFHTRLRGAAAAVLALTSCGGGPSGTTTASDPCSWVTAAEVGDALGLDVAAGTNDPDIPLCTFQFFSRTGVNTDLVVGPWSEGAIDDFELPGRRRFVVSGLGDHAVFLRANTIDDGNSVLIVTTKDRSFLVASEFLSPEAARKLGRAILRSWR